MTYSHPTAHMDHYAFYCVHSISFQGRNSELTWVRNAIRKFLMSVVLIEFKSLEMNQQQLGQRLNQNLFRAYLLGETQLAKQFVGFV